MADVGAPEHDWTARERTHQKRVDEFAAPHRRRAQAGEAHPVWDFLFTYYSLRPRQLRIWHPGFGVALGRRGGATATSTAPATGATGTV